jgi:hypothetical protein
MDISVLVASVLWPSDGLGNAVFLKAPTLPVEVRDGAVAIPIEAILVAIPLTPVTLKVLPFGTFRYVSPSSPVTLQSVTVDCGRPPCSSIML